MLQVVLAQRRRAAAALPATAAPAPGGRPAGRVRRAAAVQLTEGQRDAGGTIAADLARAHPMHRLLQGEVGSGKTVVALRAMLQVVDAGGQAALLAPTEVLAQQHYRSITDLLGPLGQAGRAGRRRAGDPGGAADRLAGRGGPPRGAARRRVRRGRDRDRHPRPAQRACAVRRPGPGGDRRAAPVRGRAARRAAGEGRGSAPARAGDDRDADPAHGRHDRLRRPGDLHADRAAGRPVADRHPRRARPRRSPASWTRAWERVREEVAPGPPGLRRLPADRRGGRRGPGGGAMAPRRRYRRPGGLPGRTRRTRARAGRRSRCSTWRPRWPRGRWPACACGCCTAGCRPRRRTR